MSWKKVVLQTTVDRDGTHDRFLESLITEGVQLLCVVGKDRERWHDVMDEIIVGEGSESRDHSIITTWHVDEALQEVVDFARNFEISDDDGKEPKVITI